MITIFKMSDRIPVKIGPIEFKIGPLSYQQKQEILAQGRMDAGEFVPDEMRMAALAMKYQIKEVSGISMLDGSDYSLEFEESGCLTDDCVSELLSLENSTKLIQALASMLNGIKETNIPGVEVVIPKARKHKRKNATGQALA